MNYNSTVNNIWTIKKLLLWTTNYFKDSLVQSPRLDAEILLAYILKTDRISLYLNINTPLTPNELKAFKECIKRRKKREPIAYITGSKEFYSLHFMVNNNVLIPRPETEILVDTAILNIKNHFLHDTPQILDIGSGSGNISVAMAKECIHARVFSLDCSIKAITVAKENAKRHKVEEKISFICGDLTGPVSLKNNFHLIVSNPPYIPTSDIDTLAPELHYEPRIALDGNSDGLFHITQIIRESKKMLTDNGVLILEIGHNQAGSVCEIAKKVYGEGVHVSVIKDYSGLLRVVTIKKRDSQ